MARLRFSGGLLRQRAFPDAKEQFSSSAKRFGPELQQRRAFVLNVAKYLIDSWVFVVACI